MYHIVSIKYDKQSGEYAIKYRNAETGKTSITTANHLKENEIIFAKSCGEPYEDRWTVQWVRR